jgi:hypothetical protein
MNMSMFIESDHQESRCILIKTMNKASADFVAAGQRIEAESQCIDQGSGPMTGRWMTHHAGCLVQYQDMIVLVDNIKGQVFGRNVSPWWRRWIKSYFLAWCQAETAWSFLAVDKGGTFVDCLLQATPGEVFAASNQKVVESNFTFIVLDGETAESIF